MCASRLRLNVRPAIGCDIRLPRRMPVPKTLVLFVRDRTGATAIEFALVAVPLLGLLMAILEMGLVFITAGNLDFVVRKATRNIFVGSAQAANVATADQFRTSYICPAGKPGSLWALIDCSKLVIDVRSSADFSSADLSKGFYKTKTTNQFCLGAPGTITVVRVAYPMPSFLPMGLGSVIGLVNDVPNDPGWKHLLISTSIFQTEPFDNASYTRQTGC